MRGLPVMVIVEMRVHVLHPIMVMKVRVHMLHLLWSCRCRDYTHHSRRSHDDALLDDHEQNKSKTPIHQDPWLSRIDRFSLGPIGDSKRGVMVLEGGRVLARGTGSCT